MSSAHDPMTGLAISTNDVNGYPCPKDGTVLELIDMTARGGRKGAWCPLCRTVWEESDECPGCGIVPRYLPPDRHLRGCPTRPHIDSEHKDVVVNEWGIYAQRRVKRIEADAPDEGDTSGIYRFTTEPHTDANCPFKNIDTIPMLCEKLDPETWRPLGGSESDRTGHA